MPAKRRRTRKEIRARRESVLWYLGVVLFVGQIALNAAGLMNGVSDIFTILTLAITGAMMLTPVFGSGFFLDLVRAIRGGGNEGRKGDDDTG